MYTGKMFEADVLGECVVRWDGQYVSFRKSMEMARNSQPRQIGWVGIQLQKSVSEILGCSAQLFTSINTPLDRFHGIDGWFEVGNGTLTLDLSLNPHKDSYKADLIVSEDDVETVDKLYGLAREIAQRLQHFVARGSPSGDGQKTHYLFSCPHCGIYDVSRRYLGKIMPRGFWRAVKKEMKKKGKNAVMLEFADYCPRCQERGQSAVKIITAKL